MIALADAQAIVLESCRPLPPRIIPLAVTSGLVLAEEVVATELIPPFANSAMDGFAVRAEDTVGASGAAPSRLVVAATIRAGEATSTPVKPGTAIRIMTGAPMPPEADAVVTVESTVSVGEHQVDVLAPVAPGQHVRPAGDDVRPGQRLIGRGETLTAAHLGVLASVGRTEVQVHPRPRVAVFSTGDELVDAGAPLQAGQIRDSNRITLLAMLEACGCEPVDLGRVPDDADAIAAVLAEATATCDAAVTSGGVSMGDFDLVKVVLDRVGPMHWMQIAIKPAKPFAFGTVGESAVPVFGLPGNPVSSIVSFELLARPALRRMQGHRDSDLHRPRVVAVVDEPLRRRRDGKVHFARVIWHYDMHGASFHVRSAGAQGSHQLSAMTAANGLAVLPDGDTIEPGAHVELIPIS